MYGQCNDKNIYPNKNLSFFYIKQYQSLTLSASNDKRTSKNNKMQEYNMNENSIKICTLSSVFKSYMFYAYILTSGCFVITSCTFELLWPLSNVTYTTEIKHNSPNQDRSAGCNIKFVQDMPPNFQNLAVSTDDDHWIDIRIEANIAYLNKDYTFSGWFKISNPNGALFHFKSDDYYTTGEFLEMKAVLASSNIIFKRKLKTANETGSFAVTLSLNNWHYFTFGIDRSNGKMKIYIDENLVDEVDDGFMDNIDIMLPGTLRIGRSFDEVDPNLIGEVTCFAYHIDKIDVPLSDSENECKNTTPDETCKLFISFQNNHHLVLIFFFFFFFFWYIVTVSFILKITNCGMHGVYD